MTTERELDPVIWKQAQEEAKRYLPEITLKEIRPGQWLGSVTVEGCACLGPGQTREQALERTKVAIRATRYKQLVLAKARI